MSILKSQSGFIGGAFVATLVASVAMLGTLITLTAGMAQKVGVTQSNLNSKKTIDRLAEYIMQNKVSNIDGDDYLELPRMYYRLNQANPSADEDGSWNEQSNYGYIEPLITTIDSQEVDLRDTIGKDAFGRDFQVCSVNIEPNTNSADNNGRREAQTITTPPAPPLRQVVFVIISSGADGQFEFSGCFQYINENLITTDDTVKVIKYGQVLEHANAKRLALLRDGIPECTSTQSLEYINVTDGDGNPTGAQKWQCRENYMQLVAQDYSSGGLHQCLDSERLALNSDGTLGCLVVDSLANNVPENINMGQLAAGICYRGYAIDTLLNASETRFLFKCKRLVSYGAEAGPDTVEIEIPVRAGSCDVAPEAGLFRAYYQSRDGTMRCLGMPNSLLFGSNCSGRPYIVFDRGKLYCFAANLSFETHETCLPNQILQFQTITNNVQCLAGTDHEPRNWIIPYSGDHTTCRAGDYIMHDGTNYICMTNLELLQKVTPSMSCSARQMVSWDESNKKFRCIFR